MALDLTEEQKAVVGDRGGELLVSAAAGSGKTFVLVQRLMDRIIREGEDVDSFLIITFTKAAASELRGKILDALNKELARKPGNRHLQRQTTLVYRAQISTIHGFCQRVLKEEGQSLDLDPDFRVAEEGACDVMKQQVLSDVLNRHYETVAPGDDFSHLLDTMSEGRDDSKLVKMVLDIHSRVQSHPDPHAWLEEQCSAFRLEGVERVEDTTWGSFLLQDSRKQAEYWLRQMKELLIELECDEQLSAKYSQRIGDLADSLEDFVGGLREGWDAAVEKSSLIYGDYTKNKVNKPSNPELKNRMMSLKNGCKDQMEPITERFSRSSAQLLDDMRSVAPAVISLLKLVEEFDEAYAAEKRRQKVVDYNDLEHMALKILTDGEGKPSPAALRLEHRYVEVMVDEYQDTNQVQNAIFNAVSGGGKKLFMVGDVKQSIYRFRLADPGIFMKKFDEFPYSSRAKEGEPRKIVLSRNFRSRQSVLDASNFLFRSLMSRDFGEISYTEDHWLNPGASYPEYEGDRTELDVIDMKGIETPEGEEDSSSLEVESDFIARRVRRLVEERHLVTENGSLKPVEWTDIVILLRAPNTAMKELTAALDRWEVPWQTEGEQDFFQATEIMVAMSYLQIIDNPHQDVPLAAVLRSPLYGFTPDQLAEIRAGCRGKDGREEGDFYTALCRKAENGDRPCSDFLAELQDLRERAADRTVSDFIWELYEQTGMLPIFSALDGGESRRSNLILLYEYARQFEQNGSRGLFDFVTHMRRLQEAGKTIELSSTRGSGVKIMSIHKSKGLEFPVVILGRLSSRMNNQDEREPMLFHVQMGVGPYGLDTERGIRYPTLARSAVQLKLKQERCAEELRLLYVAMTRAREKLILVCTQRDAYSTLKDLSVTAGFPMDPQILATRGSMGEWVLSAALTRREADCLRSAGGEPQSLFVEEDSPWDIRLLDGQKPEKEPRKKSDDAVMGWKEEELPLENLQWVYPHSGAEDIPSKLTATQLKGRFQDEEIAEEAESIEHARRAAPQPRPVTFRTPSFLEGERPLTSAQRGTAQHLFMQLCDPGKASTVQGGEEELRRLVEKDCMTEAQARACSPEQVSAFFQSELGREAMSHDMKREFKFSVFSDASLYYGEAGKGENVLLHGVVDLWYETEEGITVVDFKTDHITRGEEELRAENYRTQLNVYSRALEEITGKTVAHRYLWFFQTGRAFEVEK